MKSTFVFVVCLLVCFPAGSRAQAVPHPSRLRPLDSWAAETFGRVTARSPLARSLVRRLEDSNLIVHIVSVPTMPWDLAGMTSFIGEKHGTRYVRVTVDRQLLPDTRAAVLGHELQHALEIADSDAADTDAVRRLFETIGVRVGKKDRFETVAATTTGKQVWSELHKGSVAATQ